MKAERPFMVMFFFFSSRVSERFTPRSLSLSLMSLAPWINAGGCQIMPVIFAIARNCNNKSSTEATPYDPTFASYWLSRKEQ